MHGLVENHLARTFGATESKQPSNINIDLIRLPEGLNWPTVPAAFAASRLSSQPILLSLKEGQPQQQQVGEGDQQEPSLQPPLLEALTAAQGCPAVEADLEGLTQYMISKRIDEEQLKKLHERVDQGNTRERARLASLSLAHSGDWLNCAPVRSLGLHLRPPEFVLAAKYRLGLPIYQTRGA